jgi:hypothetical protein
LIGPPDQRDAPTPTPAEIREQVKIICESQFLRAAEMRCAMLWHIMEATLAGQPATEKTLAVEVRGKDPKTFDPAIDGIVRVEVGKIREALTKFYEKQGATAAIAVTIEKYRLIARYTPCHIENNSRAASEPMHSTDEEQRARSKKLTAQQLRESDRKFRREREKDSKKWFVIGVLGIGLTFIVPPIGVGILVGAAILHMLGYL